jgi:hypothetical protein
VWPNLRSEDRRALGSVFPPFNKAVRQTPVGELDPAANGRSFVERKRRICRETVLLQSEFALQYVQQNLRRQHIIILIFLFLIFLLFHLSSFILFIHLCVFVYFITISFFLCLLFPFLPLILSSVFVSSLFLHSTVSFVFNLISFLFSFLYITFIHLMVH